MAVMLLTDNYMADLFKRMAPHNNFLDPNGPRKISGAASMPKPAASTINNWLMHNRVLSNDPGKTRFLEALYD